METARVRLEIDLAKIRRNFSEIRRRVAPAGLMAVLKANAYGLGVLPVAETVRSAGAAAFGVAEINEALELFPLGVDVQILGNLLPWEIGPAVAHDMICPVANLEVARALENEAERQDRRVRCAVSVDSGMGRLGLLADSCLEEILAMRQFGRLDFTGIYSHCSNAFVRGDEYTRSQFRRFRKLLAMLEARGMTFPRVHIAASDALNNYPESTGEPFNFARTGINMYGYYDNEVSRSMPLEPAVELKTVLSSVRVLPAGSSIGYGRMCRLQKPMRVGTVAAGYADGMPLALSNRGYLLCNGVLCPVLGRISMDYTTVSLEGAPQARVGDEVVCFGRQGDMEIPLEQWAQLKGTHAYELLCSVGTRVRRVYLNRGENGN